MVSEQGEIGSDKKMSTSYALNLKDNLGNIITQVQLKCENYDEWAHVMHTALQAKKKIWFC